MSQSRDEENTANGHDESTPEQQPEQDGVQGADDLAAKIASLEDELAQFKDRYMRAAAETENVRRRAEKERMELSKYALESVFKDLLPVLDSFEQATTSEGVPTEDNSFFSGVLMVKKQLLDVLKKNGLEQISAKDQPFDPNFHQAIQRIESAEHKEETVAGEFQKGYVLNGRLIRPAMVSVFIPV